MRLVCRWFFLSSILIRDSKILVSCVWQWTESGDEALILEILDLWSILSLPLLPGPLWPETQVTVKISSIGQTFVLLIRLTDWFIGMSTYIGLCCAKWLENHVHRTFIFMFWWCYFLRVFFFFANGSIKCE